MSAAARLRRLDETARITVLERGPDVSFANCGLPYHVAGEIRDRESLLLHTPETLRASLDLDVRILTRSPASTASSAPCSSATWSPGPTRCCPTTTLVPWPRVRSRSFLCPGSTGPRSAPCATSLTPTPSARCSTPVLGAPSWSARGSSGSRRSRRSLHRGLDVTLARARPPGPCPAIDADMASLVEARLPRPRGRRPHGDRARRGPGLQHRRGGRRRPVRRRAHRRRRRAPRRGRPSLDGAGTRRRSRALPGGRRGRSPQQRTRDPHIWAVGDAIQVTDLVTARRGVVPLAGPANRQGRVAADAIMGRDQRLEARPRHGDRPGLRAHRRRHGVQRRAGSGSPASSTGSCTSTPATTRATTPAPRRSTSRSSSHPTAAGCSERRPSAARVSTSASTCSPPRCAPA